MEDEPLYKENNIAVEYLKRHAEKGIGNDQNMR
jgi:hypothetical protein